MTDKIKLGISACLLGERVRYDGGHKLDRLLLDTLGRYVEYVPVCPEVECGLTVPREAFELSGNPENPRLVTVTTKIDHTERMLAWGKRRLRELESEDLCGYIFKSNSPSCGIEGIKIYNELGIPTNTGNGIWARLFMEHFPIMPVEDESRLHDPPLRENFIVRIFEYNRRRENAGHQNGFRSHPNQRPE